MHSSSVSSLVGLLARHYDELIDHLRRRFRDKEFAAEVLHDVCVQLLERPPKSEIRAPQAFLKHVSTQAAIDRYRVEKARANVVAHVDELPESGPHLPFAGLQGGELTVAFQQKQELVLAAVRELPERCQEVFILHKLYHLPQAEVAAKLGISRGMVVRHMARAAASLAPVLNEF